MEQADGFLKIPMVGFTESLNISVSAAIVIQDLTNRLRKSKMDWQLTDDEKLEKQLDWTRKSIKDIEFVESRYFVKSNSSPNYLINNKIYFLVFTLSNTLYSS